MFLTEISRFYWNKKKKNKQSAHINGENVTIDRWIRWNDIFYDFLIRVDDSRAPSSDERTREVGVPRGG